jgi:hypothetical protein
MLMMNLDRRDFLKGVGGGLGLGTACWSALRSIIPLSADEVKVTPDIVQFRPDMEEVVRWIERTPRDKVMDVAVDELKRGLSYRQLLGGLFLAGIRNIKPRPVGFKFHAVMVINSAHQLSLDAPQADRLLPFFWALDNFKSSQQADVADGDWTLGAVKESAVPSSTKARKMFVEAMERWDAEAADAAVTGLCRAAGMGEVVEQLWLYGARDWQNIGHKIIFTAQAFRTLETIGWEHAEPVLRSLVFGLLNGGASDASAPYAANQGLVAKVRPEWAEGKPDPSAAAEFLKALRTAKPDEGPRQAVDMLNRGVSASSLWDGVMLSAGELLMKKPGIVALHAVTASNSLHHAYQSSGADSTRLLLLLQAASWLAFYREAVRARDGLPDGPGIDELGPASEPEAAPIPGILEELGKDRNQAARRVLLYLSSGKPAASFMDPARHLIFTKGTDAHDYKFAAAAFEEAGRASPPWRARLLAGSVFHLRSSSEPDSPLLERTRQAMSRLGT